MVKWQRKFSQRENPTMFLGKISDMPSHPGTFQGERLLTPIYIHQLSFYALFFQEQPHFVLLFWFACNKSDRQNIPSINFQECFFKVSQMNVKNIHAVDIWNSISGMSGMSSYKNATICNHQFNKSSICVLVLTLADFCDLLCQCCS